ncbi:DnaB-like helicase C-terminal domain-containing protein [Fibrobacter sp.]|uniref:DnaB-like helicase C-terminal domain-containing protein n=1 Tax=Fibrobacter sp. TaxID=35828 RepID=UPI003868F2A4
MAAVYDLTREDLVLRTYLMDFDIAPKMVSFLDDKLYSDATNKTLIGIIRKFIRKYNRRPQAQELIVGLANSGLSETARQKLLAICNAEVPYMKQDYVITLLENFYQEKATENALRDAATALYDNDTEKIRDLLPVLRDRLNFSLHMGLGLDLVEDIEEAQRRLKEMSHPIRSAIGPINQYTAQVKTDPNSGGYPRKTMTLFVGQPNVGKSLVMGSDACNFIRYGYDVLYISLELSEEYVWRRLAANLTGVPQYEVADLSVDECRKLIENTKIPGVERLGRLKVIRMKTTTTPAEIEARVDQFYSIYKKNPDVLVVDYIGIMKPNRTHRTMESMYLDGQEKAEQIRELCIDRNMVGISAVQFNRSGYSRLDAGLESVSGSAGFAETADIMITITRDDLLKKQNMYANFVKKNRFGENEVMFYTKYDYNTMRWYDATTDDIAAYTDALTQAQIAAEATNGMNQNIRVGTGGGNRGGGAPRGQKLNDKQQAAVASMQSIYSQF